MALHAATVEILVEKARFEPAVALGVAEAIESAMTQAQFVTVPILDARIHEVRAEIRVLEGKLDASVQALTDRMDMLFARMDAKIDARLAQMDAKIAQAEARLVRWVFLVMLGNVALSLAATTVVNALKTL